MLVKIMATVMIAETAGFRHRWTEFFRRLGYYTAWSGLKPTFRDYLSIQSLRVKMSKKHIVILEDGADR